MWYNFTFFKLKSTTLLSFLQFGKITNLKPIDSKFNIGAYLSTLTW
jgi:hypothetical protein